MKKRRTFDIDLPEEAPAEETFPAGKVEPSGRRSPMAAAITENADSLRERRVIEAEIRAENDALAAEHVRMKQLGLIVDLVPLDQVETWKLTRDRLRGDDLELAELVASLRDIGLSNPIRVEQREDGKYELVQGFRRLSAYRQLLAETGDEATWGRIPAGILPRGEDLDALYRRMVDENLVRKDISFAEMAMLAINYAADPLTARDDPDKAVAMLFQSAGYSKRSYIRAFIPMMAALGDVLQFAPHIPRALGLQLATALEDRPELAEDIRVALRGMDNRSVAEELALLRRAAGQAPEGEPGSFATGPLPEAPRPPAATGPLVGPAKARTTFQLRSTLGTAKCTAANGRLEIKLDCDFSAVDRRRLEAGLARLLAEIA